MATIVEMINPLTGLPEQVDKLDHTAQEIDDAVALAPQISNPNLLDNWYFGNPVNQRGQTSWVNPSDWQYAIDRWQVTSSSVITLVDGGITITADFHQGLEKVRLEFGRTYTFSVLSSDGRLGKHTFVLTSDTDINIGFGFGYFVCFLGGDNVWFRIYGDGSTYKAAKLELGSQQTLAHQENGVWVLNEIPDYGEQLRRCQRYFVRIGVPAAQENAAIGFANCANTTLANTCINTPVTMRAIPTATIKNIVLRKGITDSNVTACNIFSITGNGIYMNFVSSGLTTGDTLLIRTVTGGYIDFTADL